MSDKILTDVQSVRILAPLFALFTNTVIQCRIVSNVPIKIQIEDHGAMTGRGDHLWRLYGVGICAICKTIPSNNNTPIQYDGMGELVHELHVRHLDDVALGLMGVIGVANMVDLQERYSTIEELERGIPHGGQTTIESFFT